MQQLLENIVFAFVGAIAILIMILLLGVGVGYREEIRRRISIYARVIITTLLLLTSLYLYLQGVLNSDTLFIAVVWLLPAILYLTGAELGEVSVEIRQARLALSMGTQLPPDCCHTPQDERIRIMLYLIKRTTPIMSVAALA